MMAYKIMLVMLIFSSVNAGINASGMYLTKLPEQSAKISTAQVTDLTTSVSTAPLNPWTTFTMLEMVLGVIGSALLGLITIAPLLLSFGFPLWEALMISSPMTLVIAWGLYEIVTGHVTIPQD
jgi:hypothetical protein